MNVVSPSPQVDPLDVLNLPQEYTMDQLRYNYKLLARQLHPDKRVAHHMTPEQATETFQLLTWAYKILVERLEGRGTGHDFHALRQASRQHHQQQAPPDTAPSASSKRSGGNKASSSDKRGFNIDKFNRIFDENRLDDPVRDGGYGRWMEDADPDSKRNQLSMIAHSGRRAEDEPIPVALGKSAFYTDIVAVGGVEDYSRHDLASSKNAIQYTDYRIAHTTARLADEDEISVATERAHREARNIEVLKQTRGNLSYTMSPQEEAAWREKERRREEAERMRLEAISSYDIMLDRFHQRTSRLLL